MKPKLGKQKAELKGFSQYLISLLSVAAVAGVSFFFVEWIGYRSVALILLMVVSVLAMVFDILPVLLAALLSALVWNFFFIPPLFTFHVASVEDLLMFLLYFVIAFVNTVLTRKIRIEKEKARDREEKEAAIQLYNTLLNSLSHELRTPIATIIGSTDLLKEGFSKLNLSEKEELLNQIEGAGLRLNRQVENLLNMSRLDQGLLRIKPDWCDTNELAFAVKSRLDLIDRERMIIETSANMPLVFLDEGLMEQVLHNLVHNALQHTSRETTVHVSNNYVDGHYKLSVSDNGPGIPEGVEHKIFDKFYSTSSSGGSGLGLSIVRGISIAHGGDVGVSRNDISGLKFVVDIPAKSSYMNHIKHD